MMAQKKVIVCEHCKKNRYPFGRGLCKACYRNHRDEYPRLYEARWEYSDIHGEVPLADCPTAALPGTEAKILVMQARMEKRVALFHPSDGRVMDSCENRSERVSSAADDCPEDDD
jgi:hypothetical protein